MNQYFQVQLYYPAIDKQWQGGVQIYGKQSMLVIFFMVKFHFNSLRQRHVCG